MKPSSREMGSTLVAGAAVAALLAPVIHAVHLAIGGPPGTMMGVVVVLAGELLHGIVPRHRMLTGSEHRVEERPSESGVVAVMIKHSFR